MTRAIDLAAACVLAIDFQEEYRAGGAWPVEGYAEILERAQQVAAAARRADLPVFHVQAWSAGDGPEGRLARDSTPETLRFGVAGSRGAAIAAEMAPADGEIVIRKTLPSGFRGTGLADELSRHGLREIIGFGVWTESCLRDTLLDAVHEGFRVWLVKDACGSGTAFMHRCGVLDLANRLYGGGVLSAENAVRCLESQPYEAWRFKRPVEFAYDRDTVDAAYEAL
jgi:maleamate amidohydrolase